VPTRKFSKPWADRRGEPGRKSQHFSGVVWSGVLECFLLHTSFSTRTGKGWSEQHPVKGLNCVKNNGSLEEC